MKKIIVLFLFFVSFSFAIRVGSLELSPEVGAGAQKVNINGQNHYDWSAYGRLWIGAFDWVVAPQVKYNEYTNTRSNFTNWQYGALLGYGFDVLIIHATIYAGANYSQFNEIYNNTISYNAGIKIKPLALPLALGVEYEYQRPKHKFLGVNDKIDSLRFNVGIHF